MSAVLWLNDLPLWTAALVIIGGTVALSIIGTAVSGIFFGEQALSLNNVVGGFKYMFVAGIYAGFLGFLLLGVYNRYDKVRAAMEDPRYSHIRFVRLASPHEPDRDPFRGQRWRGLDRLR